MFTLRSSGRHGAATSRGKAPGPVAAAGDRPWGGLFLAEDGLGDQHLVAVSERGSRSFARNRVSGSEFTGGTVR